MTRRVLLTALALLIGSAGAGAAQKKAPKPVTHTVTVDATSFQPATLTLAAGDSVVWVNKDIIPHTATSAKKGIFDSGTIATGESWKHTFKTAGDLAYICQFHPTMKGSLKIK
ncbi:MAG TPA: cupredoxin family copper-binding protein [Vicinamibacterales bacterium]|nr:cupredoxin family copper-binding protein [Vicinamibacterales bacterium]